VRDEAKKYNWDGLTFPMELDQIDKFEAQNDVSVSVYGLDESLTLESLRVSKIKKYKDVMLLLVGNEEIKHYVIIQDLSRLVDTNLLCSDDTPPSPPSNFDGQERFEGNDDEEPFHNFNDYADSQSSDFKDLDYFYDDDDDYGYDFYD
jgi:hypothetical protein